MVLPFADTLADPVDGLFHGLVAGGLGDDLEPVEDRHAAGNHGPQGPGELGHRDLADQDAENRQFQRPGVNLLPPLLGRVDPLENKDERDNGTDDHQDIVLNEIAQIDDDLGRHRQRAAEIGKQLCEGRDDEDQNDGDDHDGNADDGRRVGHGTLDLFLQLHGFFDVGRQPVEDGVENPADLPRRDEVDIEFVEGLGVFLQSVGKGGAGLDALLDLGQHFLEGLIVLLPGENIEALHQRQTGIDHGGKHGG